MTIGYTEVYDLEEQVEDLSEVTGLGKHIIRRVLKYQRRFAQEKLSLGYAYNLKGVVKIEPNKRGDRYVLKSKVAQAVTRPRGIRKRSFFKNENDELKEQMVEDEDLM